MEWNFTLVRRDGKAINERYRPMRFSELIGNQSMKTRFANWIQQDPKERKRALLLCGTSSGGKTTTAKILAMGLNCEHGDTLEPCLECKACKSAMNETAYNIIERNMADYNKVEDARNLSAEIKLNSLSGRNKVYILDEVQRMTSDAQNVLLKDIENPPRNVYLIFCTTEPNKLLPTLRNRCAVYNYELPTRADIIQILGDVVRLEEIKMEDDEKRDFLEFAQGLTYREILEALESFKMGGEVSKCFGEARKQLNEIAFAVIYKGDLETYKSVLAQGDNIDFEALRRMMRMMAGKELEKNFSNLAKAEKYAEIVEILDEHPMFDYSPRPTCSSMVFQISLLVKSMSR